MNNPVQQLMSISDPDQLHKLDMGNYKNLWFHLYWKDINNKYHGANERYALTLGLKKGADVINHTDFDFFPREVDYFKGNDCKVINDNKATILFETATLADGSILHAVSHKTPWYSAASGKLLGIHGLSFITIQPTHDTKGLSARQLDCLYYLVKGFSIKEIAKKLTLSPRTVEHYFEAIKFKLNCYSRAELIEEALKMNLIKERLF